MPISISAISVFPCLLGEIRLYRRAAYRFLATRWRVAAPSLAARRDGAAVVRGFLAVAAPPVDDFLAAVAGAAFSGAATGAFRTVA